MTITRQEIEKLEQMDIALYEILDKARSLIAGGEYDHAKIVVHNMEADLDRANKYANKLASKL